MYKDYTRLEKAQILSLAAPPRSRRFREKEPCGATGCHEDTTEGKPYCSNHIDHLDYVKGIQKKLQEFDADLADASRSRPVIRLSSPWVKEILLQLAIRGAQTLPRLCLMVDLPEVPMENFAKALDKAGLVKYVLAGSRRGTTRKIVHITDAGRVRAREEV